ncbi:MAG TPA: hypothetical protein VN153_02305, partial [Tahibacter sp.]|nr:hypothetical protein [Tahibacter sp.]
MANFADQPEQTQQSRHMPLGRRLLCLRQTQPRFRRLGQQGERDGIVQAARGFAHAAPLTLLQMSRLPR